MKTPGNLRKETTKLESKQKNPSDLFQVHLEKPFLTDTIQMSLEAQLKAHAQISMELNGGIQALPLRGA